MNKDTVIKSIKIAIAAVLSIAIAGELGLKYSATAGIITVLSIQNTKRETLNSARNRTFAFLCALILSAALFHLLDYTLFSFACYLLLFSLLCLYADWGEAIAMDSVLITHFLTEQSFSLSLVGNEIALFFIGTTVGVIINMHLRRRTNEFKKLSNHVDQQIKSILNRMSHWLLSEDKAGYEPDCFVLLQTSLKKAQACALINYNNALFKKDLYEVDYIQMRQQQSEVLFELYDNIKSISCLPSQAKEVAALLERIQMDYHRNNTVKDLLKELDRLLTGLKQHELPTNREEFEARAILFYILKQLKRLLMIKREFMLSHKN